MLYSEPVRAVLHTGPVEPWIYGLAWLGPPLVLGLDGLRKSVVGRLEHSRR
ncbi:MAG: hypothetical protein MZV65_49970 [Chromatiales bacterium]|nr:hypothetical protein [Chromatiales bacterium]